MTDATDQSPEALLLRILSLLPTHLAAQTSCISYRFRRLWSASPSLYFDSSSSLMLTGFLEMLDRALLHRDHSAPLESLCIKSCYRIRHLHLELKSPTAAELCRVIFSIESLESLHIKNLRWTCHKALMRMDIICTCLRSLTLCLNVEYLDLTRLVRELPVLELELTGIHQSETEISLPSLRTLKLHCRQSDMMKLCFPKLDFIYLHCNLCNLEMFQGEMPLVSKANFHLTHHTGVDPCILGSMLKRVANAVELKPCLSVPVSNP